MNPKVDAFLRRAKKWQPELAKLRAILLDSQLTEELKWRVPVYTFQKSNIIGINGLKESCALSFFKGVLLKDPKGILIRPGQHSQAARWIKFTSVQEITKLEPVLKAYVHEAIEAEKAGLKIILKKTSDYAVPVEFKKKLAEIPALKATFAVLTPGRQRGYLLYFAAPKQSKTRDSRIQKCLPQILKGKGLNDE